MTLGPQSDAVLCLLTAGQESAGRSGSAPQSPAPDTSNQSRLPERLGDTSCAYQLARDDLWETAAAVPTVCGRAAAIWVGIS